MFGVLHLADFALQAALRHQPELKKQPVALMNGNQILQVTDAARAGGINPGMTSTQGLARIRNLLLLPRVPGQENAAGDALLQCAFSCSPWVEATAPGVCTFECRGTRLKNETLLAERVLSHLATFHLTATAGFASNPDLALLAAQSAQPVLSVGKSAAFAAELPLTALATPSHLLAIFHKWGVHNVGQLARLQPGELTERLGPVARRLWDRATGRSHRLLQLATIPPVYEESIEFENALETLDPLLFILRRFLEQLCLRLEAVQRIPATLGLHLTFANGSDYRRLFRIPSPTRDIEILFRILHTHLENFTAESAISALHLEAQPTLPQSEQFGLFETALRDPNRFYETLGRLHALLGPDCAGTPVLDDTHRPDRFHLEVPDFRPGDTLGNPVENPIFGLPLRRFRPPIAAQVVVARQSPVQLRSPLVAGEIRDVRGPFQLSGDWWDQQPWAVQEWDVELVGGGLYRLSEEKGNWKLEGIFG